MPVGPGDRGLSPPTRLIRDFCRGRLPARMDCTLNLIETPVTIKTIECAIVDRGWEEGWIAPEPASHKTGKKVSVIGSGPAGKAPEKKAAPEKKPAGKK